MIREYFAELFRLAWAETRERIRQDRERCPKRFAPLFRVIEKRLFEPGFNVQAARRQSGILQAAPPIGKPLSRYLGELRIQTALRMLELANGRIPTGAIAVAVGLRNYLTWRRTFERVTDEKPPLVRLPDRLSPRFDDVTWHHVCHGKLSLDDAEVLIERLRRLYPQGWGRVPPPAQFLSPDLTPRRGSKVGGISDDEARVELKRAAVNPRARLERDAEGLPPDLVEILMDLVEHLFDSVIDVSLCRRRVGLRDTSTTTRLSFYLGDTFDDLIERRRIETAVALIGNRRFAIERIAEEIGMTYRSFSRIFRKRTGATGNEIRKTLLATADHPAYDLWSRAEGLGLSHDELRTLVGYFRGIHPEISVRHETVQLAVRTDVDPRRVEEVLQFDQAIVRESPVAASLDTLIQTHPDYSAEHWYVHWIRDRLNRQVVESAWVEWLQANRDLGELLELPREKRSERVRKDRKYQTDAFLWLLVDSVGARLFQDAAESEHFADLAVAVGEALWQRDRRPGVAALFALALALKGNTLQRRSEYKKAELRFRQSFDVAVAATDPWALGRINSLYASLLDRTARHQEALEKLFLASALFKKGGDDLERLRCVIQRCSNWYSLGRSPVRLLTRCIAVLRRYPFATSLVECAHLNRLEACIYLNDQLTGASIPEIKVYRSAMPLASSPFTQANYMQLDGLIAAMENQHAVAISALRRAFSWFDKEGLVSYAAVCRLQYSWAIIRVDQEEACRAARHAYVEMKRVGFSAHGLQEIAHKIYEDSRQGLLRREALRRCILSAVCPAARLTKPAGPSPS